MTASNLRTTRKDARERGEYEQIENDTLKKLKAIQELDNDTKNHIFATIDTFIKAAKL